MAKTRVSELAKEFGIPSKEMLEHLRDMKIPAKSASSALEDAYVSMVRKKLAPVLKAREEEIRRAQEAEEAARKEEEEARRAAEEAERRAAEERRAKERAEEEARRAAEEAARKAEEERRAAEEAARKAEEEKNRVKDTAPTSMPKFTSLLEQIAQQEEVLKQQKEAAKEAKEAKKAEKAEKAKQRDNSGERRGRPNKNAGREARGAATASRPMPADMAPSPEKAAAASNRRNNKKHRHDNPDEDRFDRSTRSQEEYNRERILEDARASVEEANRESTGRRKKRKEHRQKQAEEAAKKQAIQEALANDQDITKLDVVKVPQGSTVAEVADLLEIPANDIVKRLFLLGVSLTMTQTMSDDLIELIADDLGRKVKVMTKEEENSFTFYDDPKDLVSRPPVVTVMGHVDHGKTSTLDAIRHTGVAAGEAGGITQHIGASQVKINGRIITFVDTPGHETFTAMRARGAKVTDIVVLVVAADDGVMPQTIESINHAKAAGVPIVVAVNKIDRDDANPDRVRQELTEYGVIPEEWGGENMFVNISAKKGIGIDELLETILLQADVLELKANPNTFASGYVLEAKLDRGRGSVATLLVNRGTLHVGDSLVAGMSYGRVRAMLDQHGNPVEVAGPSDPVEILGLSSVPAAGDEFRVFQDERDARDLAESRALKARIEEQNKVKHITLENLFDTMQDAEVKELNLVVKADVQGSIEALSDALGKMDQSEVRINIIHSAVGAISETDVILADASNAIIIGFGVRPEAKARTAAERDNVQIKCYQVIYKAIEDIDAARIGMLQPTEEEVQTGVAEVRDTFKVPKVGIAAGCMVTEGEISRDDSVRLTRNGIVIYDGKIASLRRYKDDVKSVKSGYECGIGLENYQDIHPGDLIEGYKIVQVARTE
ncbi:translation initiation factor IF-2 [Leptogranulimonas caecicola]|uniref:Translation initiation factor IF-2 n=1 Tax=Leptogranulimonas caecicola TaxID=2894156 RepID=A0AAU9CAG6_9ACTN|nr:translation initiation factor IF-2 [Leptogranulimonas caecicola]BCV18562.1 translation initiation factor IF-2 [Atopobiaceae bacterium P1]BDC90892.1 translation initiation factor IF-2 [Leptogranulimonas caecicola]